MKRLVTILLFTGMSAAFAQQPPQRDAHRGPPKGPPQEALDACKGKRAGDAVQAKMPRGEVRGGTCQLVMVVDHGQDKRPPPRQ